MDKESLRQYLNANSISYVDIVALERGGVVNYIWRVTAPDGGTSIIKHASYHLRVNKAFLVPLDRMHYEVHALRTIPGLLPGDDTDHLNIQPPVVLHYNAEKHTIQLSDGGSRNLAQSYRDPAVDVQAIGSRLGVWLANLHAVTSSAAVLPTVKAQFNNLTGKRVYRTSLNGLAAALAKFGHDPALGERMNAKFGAMLDTDEACLVHGDFWTANVVVADAASSASSSSSSPGLTVIDWELTRVGNGATDVGQFAAEAWLLDTFAASRHSGGAPDVAAGRGLVGAFLKAYLGERRLGDEDKIRVAAQFGTLMVYYPSILSYPDGGRQPAEMVKVGIEMLRRIDAGDVAALKGSALRLLWMS